ncbi:MAG TPA: SCO family protein [Chthoniobacterales bacterium]
MRNFLPCATALIVCLALGVGACGRGENRDGRVRHFDTRGIVRSFAPDRATIDVEHETIPGFMPSMTMPFTARDSKEIANLRIGDGISFRIDVTDRDVWIADVKKISANDVQLPKATPSARPSTTTSRRLKEGDVMPVFELTNEKGERVTLDSFRGRPWILTFIFTRCPMPNFCPRMAKNFAALQSAIKSGDGALAQARLLSITIDPQFDSPAILKDYGQHEGADPKIWTFATGATSEIEDLTRGFAVYTEREGGTITHGLTTALIDRDGNIAKLWRGNAWTTDEALAALRTVTQP